MPRWEAAVKQPTSVTGISIPEARLPRRHASRGFTLWELVIVVAIFAITLSIIQFSFGLVDNERDLKRVGRDLGKLFHLLNQEAVFEDKNFAISINDENFVVLEYDGDEWQPSGDRFFRSIALTESQTSMLIIENQVIDISKTTKPQPHILILSSGEMTPFEWRIEDSNTQSGILLQGNLLGSVLMTGPEPIT